MGVIFRTLRFYWVCACEAARGTLEWANAWYTLPGLVVMWWLGLPLPADPRSALIFALVSIGAGWVCAFVVKFVRAPAKIYEETHARIAELEAKTNEKKAALEGFCIEIGKLVSRRITEDEFEAYRAEANDTANRMNEWIKASLGEFASSRFLEPTTASSYDYGKAINPVHSAIIGKLTGFRRNLTQMIDNKVWE